MSLSMMTPLQIASDIGAGEGCREAEAYRQYDVKQRLERFTLFDQQEDLHLEGGEGRVAADKAGEYAGSQFRRDCESLLASR